LDKLTDKQEKFVLGLIEGKSQREAYKAAYNTSKMKDKTIDERASRLFNECKVNARYNELHDRLVNEAADEAIVTGKEVLKEIKSIAFDDIGNYLSFRTEKTFIEYGDNGEPVLGYDTVVDIKDSKTINTKNIAEVSRGRDGQFKFKLYSRDTALYKLAEILGLSKEIESGKTGTAGEIEIIINRNMRDNAENEN